MNAIKIFYNIFYYFIGKFFDRKLNEAKLGLRFSKLTAQYLDEQGSGVTQDSRGLRSKKPRASKETQSIN